MDTIITSYLSQLEMGELQRFKNMGVIPLFTFENQRLEYLTMGEALEKRLLVVKEVSLGGSVPELRVTNRAESPVLLIDGEELVGAKQNRVLNTSILLRKKSETIIPVSCTEQGRWSYVSEAFADSGVVLASSMRSAKAVSVSSSLEFSGSYESDQGAIWDDIEEMSAHAEVRSPTSSMSDVYKSKMDELDKYLKAFQYVPRQKGLLVFFNGEVTGFDIVSLQSAYEKLHSKIVKSYAMDAFFQKKRKGDELSLNKADIFLEEAALSKEKKYKSVGHGWDYRFGGETVVGSALVYRKNVIHMAFFRTTVSDKAGRMAGYRRRKDFRV